MRAVIIAGMVDDTAAHTGDKKRRGLIALMTLLAIIQAGSVVRLLRLPDGVANNMALSPTIQTIGSFFWALIFTWAAYSLLSGSHREVKRALWLLIGFILYSVLRLLLFAQADYDRQRFPFLIVMSAAGLIIIVSVSLVRQALVARPIINRTENISYGSKSPGRKQSKN